MKPYSRRRNLRLRIQDALDAIDRAQCFTEGLEGSTWHAEQRTFWAVVAQFQIIGEVCGLIPKEDRTRHPKVPWDQIRGMRNVIVHEYFRIDEDLVWMSIVNDLEPLAEVLRSIADDLVD